ncbi:MAG: hypothetical protein SWJ54_02590 [Cyanobacteriota bacterium]|nr:hypothetical protein [Cyanobacteriota bacterium]
MGKTTQNQSPDVLLDINERNFNFEQWAKAVKPQLIAALRGNFTITPQPFKSVQSRQD